MTLDIQIIGLVFCIIVCLLVLGIFIFTRDKSTVEITLTGHEIEAGTVLDTFDGGTITIIRTIRKDGEDSYLYKVKIVNP